ncbi:MAG TPA: GDSL-type esterase/lipase family protein [Candidatus Limnocylindrales bacterium]|nr:GDSL-type esterase/lipase family protein [Candidatus Limnocylindrales bacterium]
MKGRFALAAIVAAAGLLLAGVTPALAQDGHHDRDGTYLALGDSYAFSYSPLLDPRNAANFVGYSDSVAHSLDLGLTNAACPGETSGSFVSGTAPDNGCHENYPPLPLHVSYTGSQLAFAVQYLKTHRHTQLVTLQVGGNDLLILLDQTCHGDLTCTAAGLQGVETQMAANLTTIYTAIRRTAHYHGVIVSVPYFAFNYNDAQLAGLAGSLDGVESTVAQQFGARVADVFDAFKTASAPSGIPCLAGLQVPTPPTCDIHPSAAGHAVIASAILAALSDEHGDLGGDHGN